MFPDFFFTVRTPSPTIQSAGDPSFTWTHSSSFLPSNSTIASEGGAANVAPGVTTGGTGSHTSVSSGFIFSVCWAHKPPHTEVANTNADSLNNSIRFIHGSLHERPPALPSQSGSSTNTIQALSCNFTNSLGLRHDSGL